MGTLAEATSMKKQDDNQQNKTAIIFSLEEEIGALSKALQVFELVIY